MSFVATAIVSAVSIGTAAYQARESRKAQKKGREQALSDRNAARRAEVFAETEGEGIGGLGQVNLEVDDELEEENIGKSTVSI